jgi:hypothetical protein
MIRKIANLLVVIAFGFPGAARAAVHEFDVVVYGGASAGIVAAVQSARMGKSVVLLSPQKRLGGMTTNGLGATDSFDNAAVGGVAREFYQCVKSWYDDPSAWSHGERDKFDGYRAHDDAMWRFEPHVAEEIFDDMLREANVTVVQGERLIRSGGSVTLDGNRIMAMRTEPSGDEYRGQMFIDATYEGDLMAAAGVTYTVGRESNAKYEETLNGVEKALNVKSHRFVVAVDPFVTPGNPKSGLIAGVAADTPGEEGAADQRVQAYCFRMCLSNAAANRRPFTKPPSYDPARYELLLRNFEAGDERVPFDARMMPNGKTDSNNNGAVSTDHIGANYDYPEASYERRAEIVADHLAYQQGLMWTLANHPRVPESVRRHMEQWGLAADEFTDNGGWPTELYVREARRMVSDYVMTEHDCRRTRVPDDPVGMGTYNMDSHNCQRYVDAAGHVQNEGDVQVSTRGAYAISYRSLIPRRGEAENLLVPVCISASHISYGSIRMEPVFMILGQSAASAACLAIDANAAVQDIDYASLRERLIADKQVLMRAAAK